MQQIIDKYSQEYLMETIAFRRKMHRYPELSFKETKTAELIIEELDKNDIKYRANVGGNGIVATIQGKSPEKKIIALRADFDALPILEENNCAFCSENKGVMHACGHDIHTATLLSVAKILNKTKDLWEGTIHCVFQHAEEVLPGGAIQMLDANLFGHLQPEFMIAQHVDPDIPTGTFGLKSGKYMASSDEIYLTINGKGGHGALPHKINDTVLAASQTIVNLQQIASRIIPADIPVVLSFGKMMANGATNVIPDTVEIEGTFRIFDEHWRKKAHAFIKNIAESTAISYGVTCNVNIKNGYPVLENDPFLTELAKHKIVELYGEKHLNILNHRMTSEDFAYFSQKYKSVFYRLGVGHKDQQLNLPLHSSKFNPNEDALKYAVPFMLNLAMKILE